jgi:DNA-binding CsgD family transcriptional regulator
VLVLHGEAGIGKTALLDYAAASASGLRTFRAVGVESERELPYAALHQVCGPILDRIERLPTPQQNALRTTFGLDEGPAPSPFLIGLALLNLLAEAADESPVLCLIDDAQWMDLSSARAFTFMTHRLRADPIGVLVATRQLTGELPAWPSFALDGLQYADARSLIVAERAHQLPEAVMDQILSEARGNPLALLELTRGQAASRLAGRFGLPEGLSTPGNVEQRFAARIEELPQHTQTLLLLAAADPTGDRALLCRAADRLKIPLEALEPAESADLLAFGARIRFRHPLVRSAIYRAAVPRARRRAHLALAEVTDAAIDPDRRAWHLAEATLGSDEDLAAELEQAADRARARGGFVAAAAFLDRAFAVTPEPAIRTRRALAAGQAHLDSGSLEGALDALAVADAALLTERHRVEADLLRAQIAFASSRGTDAPPLLLDAARRLERLDVKRARETYLDALIAAIYSGRRAAPGFRASEIAGIIQGAARPPGPPRATDLLLDGLTVLYTSGYAAAVPALQRAQHAFAGDDVSPSEQVRWTWLASVCAHHVWDDRSAVRLSEQLVKLVREVGALGEVSLTLRTFVHLLAGELRAAETLVGEVEAEREATGSRVIPYSAVAFAAFRGREGDAVAIQAARTEAAQRGEGNGLTVLDWAEAMLYNGLGRYPQASAAVLDVMDHRHDLTSSHWGMVELIEASVRSGKPTLADSARVYIVDTAEASGTDWAHGIAARCEALLAEDNLAEQHYVAAIDHLARCTVATDLARGHLLYGEWLRRQRRRVESRQQLRTAADMFQRMGLEAFAARAMRELRAAGVDVQKHAAAATDGLTPQELQVARLARDGLSNAEIATRLFISKHTVAYHLRKVFSKLGVSSRSRLDRALPEP